MNPNPLSRTQTRAGDFANFAKALMRNPSSVAAAIADAEREYGHGHPVVQATKAAVLPLGTASASALVSPAVGAFLASLPAIGAFDAAVGYMLSVPLGVTRAIVVTQGIRGSGVAEGAPKPIGRLSLSANDFAVRKAAAMVIVSDELARLDTSNALIDSESRNAVVHETDVQFVTVLSAGAPVVVGTGNPLDNLASAVGALSLRSNSRLFLLGDPATIARLSLLAGSDGSRVFPDLGVSGGVIADITVIATDAVAEADTSGATLILFDASQLIGAPGNVELSTAHHANVQLDDAPTNPVVAATVMVSLWQQNLTGVRAERFFIAEKLRANAAVVISDALYG